MKIKSPNSDVSTLYSLSANLSRPRFWIAIAKQAAQFASLIACHQKLGNAALEVVEQHLETHSFLVGNRYTIADIALYAYTHVAHADLRCTNMQTFKAGAIALNLTTSN